MRLTVAQAITRWLVAQRTVIDGREEPLFPGVFAIFGHGNVTCLGPALDEVRNRLPVWRGQNEQGMGLAATAYAKATRRRQVMVVTSSIGPGALNLVTAAGVAMANRLPLLLLSGDTFASRAPDPVLQQVEHFGAPSTTANDAFRAVVRYWDRITRPEQVLSTLPQALATMLDPGECGPAFIGLPQDVQADALDVPDEWLEPTVHMIPRPRADLRQLEAAADAVRRAKRPLIVAGGGVHYADATDQLRTFAETHRIPVVETVAGRASLPWDHPLNAGPIGVSGGTSANALAAETDLVLAVGTRLQDFTTGSWTVFGDARIVALNAARYDAAKHRALAVVGDARESLTSLDLAGYQADPAWPARAEALTADWNKAVDAVTDPANQTLSGAPSYAQVLGALNQHAEPDDYLVAAAGGFPGEVNKVWRSPGIRGTDVEYGFSCMGYELAGAWGAAMALPGRDVIALCGDGSYLMMNSELYSSVLSGHKFITVLCDNGGFAVIQRLQVGQGGEGYNNMRTPGDVRVDWVAHARSLGAHAEEVTLGEFSAALARARASEVSAVVVLRTDPDTWTGGDAWWEVGVPEVSDTPGIVAARSRWEQGKTRQRLAF